MVLQGTVRLREPYGPQPWPAEFRKRAPQTAPEIPYEVDSDGKSFVRVGCGGKLFLGAR